MSDTRIFTHIHQIDKKTLFNYQGLSFIDFKKELRPKWHVIWGQIFTAYSCLLIVTMGLFSLNHINNGFFIALSILAGAILFGTIHAYIQLFFHEAAHYNIAGSRKSNDLLANALIGIFIGQDIQHYRQTHFMHHRYHGMINDGESTYFDPLNIRFIVESLFGIKVLRVLLKRKAMKGDSKSLLKNKQLLCGLFLHSFILGGAFIYGQWLFLISWLAGLLIIFPFLAALRQMLEHRSFSAKKSVNYYNEPHGAVNRLFGDSPLASILGGAGFNRHLLHHWEPNISYTQLKNLEQFLKQTPAKELLEKHRSSYFNTFIQLLRQS